MGSAAPIDLDRFDKLIGAIYDAALDATHWPEVVAQICHALNSRSALLRMQDLRTHEIGTYITHGLDPSFRQQYKMHYVHIDSLIPTVAEQPVGSIQQASSIMPKSFFKGEFYNDYALPQGQKHSAGCVLTRDSTQLAVLGLHRPTPHDRYQPQELALLERLTPHLQRALKIDQCLWQLKNETDTTQDALHRLTIGIILVNAAGKPLFVNKRAEAIIASDLGLSISANTFRTSDGSDLRTLHKLIFEASRETLKSSGAMTVSRRGSTRSLNIVVTPVGQQQNTGFQDTAGSITAALLISPSEERIAFPPETLCLLYGLTLAEARLASALADGSSLDEIAEANRLSLHTVRTQLKSCFRRTGVNRQTELVKLVLRTPTIMPDNAEHT